MRVAKGTSREPSDIESKGSGRRKWQKEKFKVVVDGLASLVTDGSDGPLRPSAPLQIG
jgi:hypothetical protein